jgi:hypothetical protein
MTSVMFVRFIYILNDILPILAKISKVFQQGYFNFSSIQATLECAQAELQQLVDNMTPLTNLEKDIQSDGRLGLLALSLEDGTKTSLQHTQEYYVQSLIDNISKRFPDIPILSALSIFNPVMIPDKKSTDFNTNGASSIDIIFKHFYSSDDDVTVDQCLAEWNLLKYNLIKMKEDLPSELDLKCTSTELCQKNCVSKT